jgi:hypothetical protein
MVFEKVFYFCPKHAIVAAWLLATVSLLRQSLSDHSIGLESFSYRHLFDGNDQASIQPPSGFASGVFATGHREDRQTHSCLAAS